MVVVVNIQANSINNLDLWRNRMNKKEKIALLIGLKNRVNQDQGMPLNLRDKVTSLLSEAINEGSKKENEGLALNNII